MKTATRLKTRRESRKLKNNAKVRVASKSDYILTLLKKGLSATQVKQRIEKKGIGVYPSEIYRVKAAL